MILKSCTCYHFDETMTVSNISFNDILLNEKSPQKRFNLSRLIQNFYGRKTSAYKVR